MQEESSVTHSEEPHSLDNTRDLSSIALHASVQSSRTETPLPLRSEPQRTAEDTMSQSAHNNNNDDSKHDHTPRHEERAEGNTSASIDHTTLTSSSAAPMAYPVLHNSNTPTHTASFAESKLYTPADTTAGASLVSLHSQHEVYRLNRELLRRRGEAAQLRDTVAELRRGLDGLASEKQTLHVQLHDCQDRLRACQLRAEEARRAAQEVQLSNTALLAERTELERRLAEAWQRVAELMQRPSQPAQGSDHTPLVHNTSTSAVTKDAESQEAARLLHAEERARALQRAEDSERHMRAQLGFAQRRASAAEAELHEARRRLAALLRCVEDWTVIEHRVLQLQHGEPPSETGAPQGTPVQATPTPPTAAQSGVPLVAGPVAHYPVTPPRTNPLSNMDTACNRTPSKTSYPSLLYGLRHSAPATPQRIDKTTMTPVRDVASSALNNTSTASSSVSASEPSHLFAAEVLGVIEALDRRVSGALHNAHLTA